MNIGGIVATDDTGAQSYTLSYEKLFQKISAPESRQRATTIIWEYLNERAKTINPVPLISRFEFHTRRFIHDRGVYFIPLLVVGLLWLRTRKQAKQN